MRSGLVVGWIAFGAAVAGCGDFVAERSGADGSSPPLPDAGLGAFHDAEPARSDLDPARGIPAAEPPLSAPEYGRAEDAVDPASCFDGEDNDGSLADAVDCADPACGGLASCCVGSGTELCCAPLGATGPVPTSLVFDASCTGDPATSCLTGVTSFGDPGPWVRENMLHPGGDEAYDSGLIVGSELDLTALRVSIETTIALPADGCTDGCLEGVGIAFTAQQSFGDNTHVQPLVALFASGTRREVVLLVGDVIVRRWTALDPLEPWAISVLPTGHVEVTYRDETERASFPTTDAARLVIYGRNRNPSATSGIGASLGNVSITASVCDMPSAWRDRAELLVRPSAMGTPIDTGLMRSPTVAHDGSRLVMVYQDGPSFYAAGRGGDDLTFIQPTTEPVLQPKSTYDAGGIADPELVRTDDGYWLFYTATDGTGRRTIARAASTGATPWAFEPEEVPLIAPTGEETGLSMPSVLRHPTETSTYIMVVRAEMVGGGHELRLFVSTDGGATFSPFADFSELDEETARPPGEPTTEFDLDEIAAPSLVIHRDAYHLYYAGRRGTRWAIGMRVSDELVFWREANGGGAVFAADGNGGDRLSVRDPDVRAAGSRVELFYAGNDGARDALFRSWRLSSMEVP